MSEGAMSESVSAAARQFLCNSWYAAGWAADLAPRQTIARTFLNKAVVMFRTEAGGVSALEYSCCHPAPPLSFGTVVGERIRCSYHGLEFKARGICDHIPSQDKIPAGGARSRLAIECAITRERFV